MGGSVALRFGDWVDQMNLQYLWGCMQVPHLILRFQKKGGVNNTTKRWDDLRGLFQVVSMIISG